MSVKLAKPPRPVNSWLLIVLFVLLWGVFSVLIHSALSRSTPGIDFYVFWSAGRVYFSHQDPYAPEVDLQIQQGIYGEAAGPDQDPMAFDYPPFVLFLIAPLVGLEFPWAQAIWLALNVLLLLSVSYGLYPQGSRVVRLLLPFFYPVVFGLILGNFVILITVFLLLFLRPMLEEEPIPPRFQVVLGVLLAWSSAKPQFVWLFLLLILLYGLRKRMWPFLGGFAGGMVVLLSLSFVFLPDWPLRWLHKLSEYRAFFTFIVLDRYLSYGMPLQAIPYVSLPVMAVCLGLTLWLIYRWWQGRVETLWLLAWSGFVAFLVHISTISYEQLIFLIPLYLWAARQKASLILDGIWVGAWALSFFLFFLDIQEIVPRASDDLPFLFYSVWLGWYAFTRFRRPSAVFQSSFH